MKHTRIRWQQGRKHKDGPRQHRAPASGAWPERQSALWVYSAAAGAGFAASQARSCSMRCGSVT